MRWNDLFADFEGQLDAAADAQFAAEVADRTRSERARVALAARLVAARGKSIVLVLVDRERVAGVITDAAASWVLVTADARQWWIPVRSIAAVTGVPARAGEVTAVERRLSVAHALRALSRDRAHVAITTVAGRWTGVIQQVGADYLELRESDTQLLTAVPFDAVVSVSSAGSAR